MPYPGMPFNPELQNLANGMANGDYSGMPGWPSYPGLPTPGMVSFFFIMNGKIIKLISLRIFIVHVEIGGVL